MKIGEYSTGTTLVIVLVTFRLVMMIAIYIYEQMKVSLIFIHSIT